MNKDELFMARAIDIAQRGSGNVSPNPMVGAVVVHKGKIIGEGWHQQYGEAHAEVRAIEAVVDKSLLKHSTIYVTLEPCAHFGNTPPCASLIIDKEIPNVVIALRDPDPRVNGKGVEMLKDVGLKVTEGVLSTSAYEMNRRFFRSVEKNRPYIILKWAQTKDGFIARQDFSSKWISGPGSRHLVHKWRTEEDAILIGSNTARYDNPSLNARDWPGKDPLRVVIDRRGLLPADLNLFSDGNPVGITQ